MKFRILFFDLLFSSCTPFYGTRWVDRKSSFGNVHLGQFAIQFTDNEKWFNGAMVAKNANEKLSYHYIGLYLRVQIKCTLNMIVYTDVISGDEMMTDAFKTNPVIDEEGETVEGLFEVDSQIIAKGSTEVDIGCGNSFGGAEEDEGVDDTVEKVNNVVDSFNYSECPFGSKTEFKEYLKEYVRKVRATLKDNGIPQPEIKAFMAAAPGIVKYLMGKYSDLQFYVGSSYDPSGAMAFSYYKDGALTPTFIYIAAGLKVAKITCGVPSWVPIKQDLREQLMAMPLSKLEI